MSDERPEIEHDGSVEVAASFITDEMIGGIVGDDPTPARDDGGKFARKTPDPITEERGDNDRPIDADNPEDDEEAPESPDAAPIEDEDDYVEISSDDEDGEPVRYKLTDLVAAHREAETLRGQVEQARKSQPLPSDFEIALEETVAERSRYAGAVEQWAQFNPVGDPPDEAMLDPASQFYDPERYREQLQMFKRRKSQHEHAAAELQALQQQNEADNQKLHRSRILRARDAISEFWPELKDREQNLRVRKDLQEFYGIDADQLATITDPTAFRVLKDALAHRRGKPAQEKAIRAVKSKPKLVRAGARQAAPTTKQQKAAKARERLANSHSLDDAADALDAFL